MDIVDLELASSYSRLTLTSQRTGQMEQQWSGAKDILSLVTHGRCRGQTFFILVCDGVECLLHLLHRLLICLKRSCGRQLTLAEPTQPKQFLPDLLQELPSGRKTKRFDLPDLVASASRKVPEAFTRVAPVNLSPLVCPCHCALQAASQVEYSQPTYEPTHSLANAQSQPLVESRMCGPTVDQVHLSLQVFDQNHNAHVDSDMLLSRGPPGRRRPSHQFPQELETEAVRSIVDMLREVGDNLDSRLREKEPTLLYSIQRQLCQEMIGPLKHTMVHAGGQTIRFLYYLTQW